MSEGKTIRLNKVLRELNISLDRAVEYLAKNGHEIDARPTTKISGEIYTVLQDGFETDANKKAASKEVGEEKRKEKESRRLELEAKLEKSSIVFLVILLNSLFPPLFHIITGYSPSFLGFTI